LLLAEVLEVQLLVLGLVLVVLEVQSQQQVAVVP
jgi:hypothetical protein